LQNPAFWFGVLRLGEFVEQACSSTAFELPVWPAALQLTKVRTPPSHGFTANRPRGRVANSVPYSTPPVLANIAAFFAKPLPLVAWPARLPWVRTKRNWGPSTQSSRTWGSTRPPTSGRTSTMARPTFAWAYLLSNGTSSNGFLDRRIIYSWLLVVYLWLHIHNGLSVSHNSRCT